MNAPQPESRLSADVRLASGLAKFQIGHFVFNQDAVNKKYNETFKPGEKPKALKFGCETNFAPKLKFLIDALNHISRQKAAG